MTGAVVHFEITGTDGAKLRSFYSDLFGWKINADNPMGYGIVESEPAPGTPGCRAASRRDPRATRVMSPSTWKSRTWRRPWPGRRASAASG